jgi:hypothetical protein
MALIYKSFAILGILVFICPSKNFPETLRKKSNIFRTKTSACFFAA